MALVAANLVGDVRTQFNSLEQRSDSMLPETRGVVGAVLAALLLFRKDMELVSADPIYARVIGIPVDRLTLLALILLAFCVATGIQGMGVVLTSTLLVTPADAAALLTHHLVLMMALVAPFVVVAGVVGLYASFYFDVSSGAAIVLTCTLIFALAWAVRLHEKACHAQTIQPQCVSQNNTNLIH